MDLCIKLSILAGPPAAGDTAEMDPGLDIPSEATVKV